MLHPAFSIVKSKVLSSSHNNSISACIHFAEICGRIVENLFCKCRMSLFHGC